MNDDRFDAMVRRLGTARSRRSALKVFGGAVAGMTAMTLFGRGRAEAVKSDNDEYALCGRHLVSTQHDDNHCGGCGNACPTHAVCSGGVCICTGGRTMLLGSASSFTCEKQAWIA